MAQTSDKPTEKHDPAAKIEMKHDGIEGTHKVLPAAVKHWQDRGWVPVDEKAAKAATAAAAADKES